MKIELNNQHKREEMEFDDNSATLSDSDTAYHIRAALLSVQSGDTEMYMQLVGILHHSERLTPDEVALLLTTLKVLSAIVSCIDYVHHEALLNSIFGMNMWNYGPDVMDALLELVIALAASNGKYVDPSLEMLVGNFMPPMYYVDVLKQPRGQARKDQVLSRVHIALKDIAELVPMAASRLSSVVVHRMPTTFKKDLEKDRLKY